MSPSTMMCFFNRRAPDLSILVINRGLCFSCLGHIGQPIAVLLQALELVAAEVEAGVLLRLAMEEL